MAQELYELPQGWEWKALGDIARITTGNTPPKKHQEYYTDGTLPFVKPPELGSESPIFETPEKLTLEGFKKAKPVDAGSILVCCVGSIGKIGIAGTTVATNQQINSITFDKKINHKWGYFYALTLEKIMRSLANSAVVSIINKTSFSKIQIPVPPQAEQERIVAKLDALFSRIDQAIAQLQHTQAQTKALFASALDAVFQRTAAGTELDRVATFENGDRGKNYPSRKHYVKSGVPFITAANLENGGIKSEQLNYITYDKFNMLGGGKFSIGDILFCLRGSLGKFAINTEIQTGGIASSLVIVRPSKDIDRNYLKHYFNSPLCYEMVKKYDNGSAQPNLSSKNLKKFMLPVPPLAEQSKIVTQLDAISERTQALEAATSAQLEKLEALKASLLDAAFRGQLPSDQ
jgi:type I restriction enzyme S subunit